MKVIVFGATGNTGRALLDQGAAAGHEMTAFVRRPLPPRRVRASAPPSSAPALAHSGAAPNGSPAASIGLTTASTGSTAASTSSSAAFNASAGSFNASAGSFTGSAGSFSGSTAASNGSAAASTGSSAGSTKVSAGSSLPEPRVIIGDVLDLAAVAAAVKGHDAVMSCLGTRPWRHVDICSGGIATIIAAMQSAGMKRIVAMSSLGVGEKTEYRGGFVIRLGGWLVLRKAFRDKLAMERSLAQTDLEWIVVRPGFLTDSKPRGKWRVADDTSLSGGMISRADTAAFMLQQLTSNEWLRKRPVLVA
ncbi:MAG TPA: NAD(P)H-binding protein [Kofleriaceae bacterium]|nr:NAD(P)H-binding protein [Kofleriaceae bacterium]